MFFLFTLNTFYYIIEMVNLTC